MIGKMSNAKHYLTKEIIEQRATELFDNYAKNIWNFPKVSLDLKETFWETYSIEDNVEVTGKTPTNLNFYISEDIFSWREFIEKFLVHIHDHDIEKFRLLMLESVDNRILNTISTSNSTFREPKEIIKGIFIELHGSASQMLKSIKIVYDSLNYEIDTPENTILEYSLKK